MKMVGFKVENYFVIVERIFNSVESLRLIKAIWNRRALSTATTVSLNNRNL